MTAIGITFIVVSGLVLIVRNALAFAEDNPEPEPDKTKPSEYELECRRAERFLELSSKEEDDENFNTARAYREQAEAAFARAEKLR